MAESSPGQELSGAKMGVDVLKKLTPERFVDNEGVQRNLYSFATADGRTVQAVFYPKEELPFSDGILKEKSGFIYGERPPWREPGDWDNFTASVREASEYSHPMPHIAQIEAIKNNKAVFLVQSSPTHLLDFAITLGASDRRLAEARKHSAQGVTTPEMVEMMDRIIAAKLFNDSGDLKKDKDDEAEALFTLSLLGDTDAQNILEDRFARLKTVDAQRDQTSAAHFEQLKQQYKSEEGLRIEELVAVHLTNFPPKKAGDNFTMQTTFDATDGQVPRCTIHFTLNHSVASLPSSNDWRATPIAIISPLKEVIRQNGNPAVLNTIDTFWETTPGIKLKLPADTTIVRPGNVTGDQLFQDVDVHEVAYKTTPLTPQETARLTNMLTKEDQSNLNQQIAIELTREEFLPKSLTRAEGQKLVRIVTETINEDEEADRNLLTELGSKNSADFVRQIYTEAGLGDKIPDSLIEIMNKGVQARLIAVVKRLAIDSKLNDMGYDVHSGGAWGWEDTTSSLTQNKKLAAELGVPTMEHAGHSSNLVEDTFGLETGDQGLLVRLKSGAISTKDYREQAFTFAKDHISEVSPASRRMLYLMGAV